MIKCPNCGVQYYDKLRACPNCGFTPLGDYSQAGQTQGQAGQGQSYGQGKYQTNSKVERNNRYGAGAADQFADMDKLLNDSIDKIFSVIDGNVTVDPLSGKRNLDFYESTWFIILMMIFFFPVGIVLLALRLYRNDRYKNMTREQKVQFKQKTSKSGGGKKAGIIVTIIGVLILISASQSTNLQDVLTVLVSGAVCTGAGVLLLGVNKNRVKRVSLYESLINNRGNTRISYIAEQTGIKPLKVRTQIQNLISNGFLAEPEQNIGAYINGEYDLIVMTRNGHPIVPIEETMKEEIARKRAQEEAERREAANTIEERALFVIADALAGTNDAEASCYLRSIDNSIRSIQVLMKQDPSIKEKQNVKNLESNYLPKAIDLIRKYEDRGTSQAIKREIVGVLANIATAFDNIEKNLRKEREDAMQIDIEVMKRKLERDGLLNSDFDLGE